jgi:hypothetical protein
MYGHVILELFLSGFCLAADGYVLRGKLMARTEAAYCFPACVENTVFFWKTENCIQRLEDMGN